MPDGVPHLDASGDASGSGTRRGNPEGNDTLRMLMGAAAVASAVVCIVAYSGHVHRRRETEQRAHGRHPSTAPEVAAFTPLVNAAVSLTGGFLSAKEVANRLSGPRQVHRFEQDFEQDYEQDYADAVHASVQPQQRHNEGQEEPQTSPRAIPSPIPLPAATSPPVSEARTPAARPAALGAGRRRSSIERIQAIGGQARHRWQRAGAAIRASVRLQQGLDDRVTQRIQNQATLIMGSSDDEDADNDVSSDPALDDEQAAVPMSRRLAVAGFLLTEKLCTSLLSSLAAYPGYYLQARVYMKIDAHTRRVETVGEEGMGPDLSHSPDVPVWEMARTSGIRGLFTGFWLYAGLHATAALLGTYPKVFRVVAGRPMSKGWTRVARFCKGAVLFLPALYVQSLWSQTVARTPTSPYRNHSLSLTFLKSIPSWLIVSRLITLPMGALFGSSSTLLTSHEIAFMVPRSHPYRDHRTFTHLLRDTPKGLPLYFFTPFNGRPCYDFAWSRLWLSWKKGVVVTVLMRPLGFLLALPFHLGFNWLRNWVSARLVEEDGETHLQQRLRHCSEHADQGDARIDPSVYQTAASARVSTESTSTSVDGSQEEGEEGEAEAEDSLASLDGALGQAAPPPMARQPTLVLKQGRVATLDQKRTEVAQVLAQRKRQLSGKLISSFQQSNAFSVKRGDIGQSLCTLARFPVLNLVTGDLKVTFENEPAMDAGGVFRDYMQSVATLLTPVGRDDDDGEEEADTDCLFHAGPDSGLLPSSLTGLPNAEAERRREMLFAVGRLMALALIRKTPFDVTFSRCIFKVLMGEAITAEDVARIDESFHKLRISPLLKDGGVAEMEAMLMDDLYFVTGVETEGENGEEIQEELVSGGRRKRVTEENKHRYVALLVEHHLVGCVRKAMAVLVEGFHDIIPKAALYRLRKGGLRAIDLELLITGLPCIDIDDWKKGTQGNITQEQHKALSTWFWKVVTDMPTEQRAKLLAFSCGNARVPAEGFAALRPPFRVDFTGEDGDHLPVAHTCFNQLCMPRYGSEQILLERLDKAMNEGAGFGFI